MGLTWSHGVALHVNRVRAQLIPSDGNRGVNNTDLLWGACERAAGAWQEAGPQ